MKARKRGSKEPFKEVEYVQLKDSYVITKADQMEFDTPSNNIRTEDEHWQDVRERAAIAAIQGLISDTQTINALAKSAIEDNITVCEQVAIESVELADELVKRLKEE